ncbi:MAG: hypothetical protein D6809_03495, partial [Gammaproteobacteria bacterium]
APPSAERPASKASSLLGLVSKTGGALVTVGTLLLGWYGSRIGYLPALPGGILDPALLILALAFGLLAAVFYLMLLGPGLLLWALMDRGLGSVAARPCGQAAGAVLEELGGAWRRLRLDCRRARRRCCRRPGPEEPQRIARGLRLWDHLRRRRRQELALLWAGARQGLRLRRSQGCLLLFWALLGAGFLALLAQGLPGSGPDLLLGAVGAPALPAAWLVAAQARRLGRPALPGPTLAALLLLIAFLLLQPFLGLLTKAAASWTGLRQVGVELELDPDEPRVRRLIAQGRAELRGEGGGRVAVVRDALLLWQGIGPELVLAWPSGETRLQVVLPREAVLAEHRPQPRSLWR